MQLQTVLQFWFTELTPQQHFAKDAALDESIRTRFGPTLEAAARCELFTWRATPEGRLAEILVLDQFSRNVYRDNPRSRAWVAQTLRGRIAKIEAAAGTPGESAATGIPDASDLSLAALCAQDAEGRHAALEDYLGRCVRGVMGLSDVLATRYFTHSADALRHSVGA